MLACAATAHNCGDARQTVVQRQFPTSRTSRKFRLGCSSAVHENEVVDMPVVKGRCAPSDACETRQMLAIQTCRRKTRGEGVIDVTVVMHKTPAIVAVQKTVASEATVRPRGRRGSADTADVLKTKSDGESRRCRYKKVLPTS